MEFEGVVIQVLPVVKGVSARGEWSKQEVIFEQSGEFGRKICVSFWGDKAMEAAELKAGDTVKVSANIESKEHNGRWYTEVRAWKLSGRNMSQGMPRMEEPYSGSRNERAKQSAPAANATMPFELEEPAAREEFDDLPF